MIGQVSRPMSHVKMKTILSTIALSAAFACLAQETPTNVYRFAVKDGTRPRMVVVNFRPANGDTFSWYGKNESTAMWTATLADKLNERFSQTRKFTMIDRKFDAEIQDELRRLSDKNAAKGDVVRLCQRLGTDFMVVGDVKFWPVRAPGANPFTGQAMPAVSQQFAEISFRVIVAPTGEIAWAATHPLNSGDYPAVDIGQFTSLAADGAACRIVEEVVSCLFPPPEGATVQSSAPTPASAPQAPATASPNDTSVRATGTGGIVTPF